MRESAVEASLKKRVEARGGLCIKMIPVLAGIPDRLVLMPGGVGMFVELKRPIGGRLSVIQILMHERLRALGTRVLVIHNQQQIEEFFP